MNPFKIAIFSFPFLLAACLLDAPQVEKPDIGSLNVSVIDTCDSSYSVQVKMERHRVEFELPASRRDTAFFDTVLVFPEGWEIWNGVASDTLPRNEVKYSAYDPHYKRYDACKE